MRIWNLVGKDLRQVLRDWKSALFLLAMPIIFTLFFGFITGGMGEEARLSVGYLSLDEAGDLPGELSRLLENGGGLRLVPLAESEADSIDSRVRQGNLAAALIVPSDFSAQAWLGKMPRTVLVVDLNSQSGQAANAAIQPAIRRLQDTVQVSLLAKQGVLAQKPQAGDAERLAVRREAFQNAILAWQDPPVGVLLEAATMAAKPASGFTQASPGMIVQFAIFGLISSAMVLVLERKTRTLQRLLSTPLTRSELIAGHALAMFLVVLAQELILVLLGQFAFGVNYLAAPLGTLLMVVSLALWAASLGLLIGALSIAEEQVILWSLLAMFLFSALGGAWFPLDVVGPTFSAIGHLTPGAWAMDGFQNILLRGQGFTSTLLPAGVLVGCALVFFTIAVWRFRTD